MERNIDNLFHSDYVSEMFHYTLEKKYKLFFSIYVFNEVKKATRKKIILTKIVSTSQMDK